jgi:hypothetical protein
LNLAEKRASGWGKGWLGTEFDMSRRDHESKVAGGRPRREVQGRNGIWNKEMRILWIFVGWSSVRGADDLPRGESERERSGHSDELFHRPESSRVDRGTADTPDLVFRSLEYRKYVDRSKILQFCTASCYSSLLYSSSPLLRPSSPSPRPPSSHPPP